MLTHIRHSQLQFTMQDYTILNDSLSGSESGASHKARQVPRAPLPATGVTSCAVKSVSLCCKFSYVASFGYTSF